MKNFIHSIERRKIWTLLFSFVFLGWLQAQTIYTVNTTASGQTGNDATRTGTLEWCIQRIAYGNDPGTNFKVVFNLGGGTQIVNIANPLSLYAAKTVEIEGTAQGSCVPLIFIRGTNNGVNGVDAGNGANLTIRNIGFQNLKNGIIFNNGNLKVYGCYFGLEADGSISANAKITECGINIGGAASLAIGGNTACERNLVMNCGSSDFQAHHGIKMNNVQNGTVINNVISGNHSMGIVADGSNSLQIKRNIIGLDVTGSKPLPNGTTGIRLTKSSNVTIGGSEADKNIISANGSTSIPHEYRTSNPSRFDMSNSAGIYIETGVKNSTISYNYIGTDITGLLIRSSGSAVPNLGNVGNGIKLETTDAGNPTTNNTIAHNVVGGNGYGTMNITGLGFASHGILIRNPTSVGTRVEFNMIGISHDNTTNIANSFSGIEMQGIHKAIIRKNTICNNVWGIFLQGDFNSPTGYSEDNTIASNRLGVDSTGKVAYGNSNSTEGGGIRIKDKSSKNMIGGKSASLGNIISGNRLGIKIEGTGTVRDTVYNNIIGLDADQNKMPNQEYGIVVSDLAASHVIGSSTHGNIISGNGEGGILIDNAASNAISGNKIGVGVDGTTQKENGGNAIQIQNNSDGNKIGDAAANSGNIIAYHPKNGVEIVDTASTRNAIRNNSIFCNTLRGIELNGKGNRSYRTPKFTGSETAIVVTGAAGDWIELYALDGCQGCQNGDTSNSKLQGKTLLKAQASPLTFTGTPGVKYTATATQAGTASLAGSNTSEFTKCYTLCLPPKKDLPVIADASPICKGSPGAVKVSNTEMGTTYKAYINNTLVSDSVVSTVAGSTITLTIPGTVFNAAGTYTITVKANTLPICTPMTLDNTATIVVNDPPAELTVEGSVVCFDTDSASVKVLNPQSKVLYTALNNTGLAVYAGQKYNAITGIIKVPVASFTVNPGINIIKVRATMPGCTSKDLADTARVVINKVDLTKILSATGPVCEGNPTTVTLNNPQSGVTYTIIDKFVTPAKTLSPVLDALGKGSYTLMGVGLHELGVKADIRGCTTADITDTAGVRVNKGVNPITVSGVPDTVCSTTTTFTITIDNPEASVTYDVFELVGSTENKLNTSPLNVGNPTYTVNSLSVGTHTYLIKATVAGCDAVESWRGNVVVNSLPDADGLVVTANDDKVCEATPIVVSVETTKSSSYTYTLLDNGVKSNVSVLRGNNGKISFASVVFTPGEHVLRVIESVKSCDADTSGQIKVIVDSSIVRDRPALVALPSVICQDSLVTFELTNIQNGVSYTLKDNGVVRLTKEATQVGQKLTFGPIPVASSPALHTFTVSASSSGCDTVLLVTTANVKVNLRPNADALEILSNDDTLCEGQAVNLQTKTTKNSDYSYQLLINGVITGAASPGNGSIIDFAPQMLNPGIYTVKVVESVTGCAADTSGSIELVVDPTPEDTAAIQANVDTSCTDANVKVSISKTQQGVRYTLFYKRDGGADVSYGSQKATTNGQVLEYTLPNLPAGDYLFFAKANSAGCDSVTLTSNDRVRIVQKPDPGMDLMYKTPICIGNTATLDMSSTQPDIMYYIYRKAGDVLLDSTKIRSYTTSSYDNPGTDVLYVTAKAKGCTVVKLLEEATIVINKFPNLNLAADGNSVCHDDAANVAVKLYGTEAPWAYAASVSDTSYVLAGGTDLIYTVLKKKLVKGANIVTFTVTVPGCGVRPVAVDTIFSIGEITGLYGKTYVCENSVETYTVPPVKGATNYEFTIPTGASVVSQNLNSITIQWGDTSTSGTIKVVPNASVGLCNSLMDSLYVKVLTPFEGLADFINEDTVCVGTTDWVGITRIQGISWDSLVKVSADSVEYLDTIPRSRNNPYSRYQVRYIKPGKVLHTYYLRNPCTNKDSIVTQQVVVLPNPIANVGEYPVIDMKHYPREVVLDGTQSTQDTEMFKFTYSWSIKPYTNVNNKDKIVASFVPEQTKQVAYLTVANEHKNMCPHTDSATIVIDLGIFIPNVFTPNSDGDHDEWEILNVNAFYPDVTVDVYSKWGTLVHSSRGYTSAWDGTRNGQEVPSATYYYVIDLKKPGFKPVAGSVTIIR